MQLIQGDLFKDFPTLKFIIPHGGGAVPYHWGRYRGLAQDMKRPPLDEQLMNNVYFDTCVYHMPGIELLHKVIPVDNILFASEMIGAVHGIDPETGHNFDDTKRYIDQLTARDDDKYKIFEGNALKVYPRLGADPEETRRQAGERKLVRVSRARASLRGFKFRLRLCGHHALELGNARAAIGAGAQRRTDLRDDRPLPTKAPPRSCCGRRRSRRKPPARLDARHRLPRQQHAPLLIVELRRGKQRQDSVP